MIEQKRILATSVPGPASQALQARKTAAVAAGVSTGLPVYVVEAAGGILRDADGNQLIDFGSGHRRDHRRQRQPAGRRRGHRADHRLHAHLLHGHALREYVEVCEKLNELTPGDHEKRSALFNSGAEAVENAVKIARHATGRPAVVAFDHAYHGRTNLTMGLTAKNMPYKHRFGPFAGELYRVPMAYPYRWPGGPERVRRAGAAHRDRPDPRPGRRGQRRGRHHRADPGRGRLHRAAEGLPSRPRRLVPRARHPPHRRRDPVRLLPHRRLVRVRPRGRRTRTSSPTAKGIAGGMPLAAVTGRADLMDAVHPGGLGGTYGGNPVACAAALAVDRDDGGGGPRRPGPARSATCSPTGWAGSPRSTTRSVRCAAAGP